MRASQQRADRSAAAKLLLGPERRPENRARSGAAVIAFLANCFSACRALDGFGTSFTSPERGPSLNWAAPAGSTFGVSPHRGRNSDSVSWLRRFSSPSELEPARHFISRPTLTMRGRRDPFKIELSS